MNARDIVAIVTAISSLGVAYYQKDRAVSAEADMAEITRTLTGALQATADACRNNE